ncbi:unnamed protein product [Prorocentrum cordatum]|uniref:Protein kinase domain-containing protein n=1 Tax=Prorocentrum cordatum TaxID=2364126 RepID=A0ABN9UPY3_9DINO|nr:unnamed protein product [Polarella glacialis]
MLLEFARDGSLYDMLQSGGRLREPKAAPIFSGVVSGLEHLHSKGVIHRDVKPENILICRGPTGEPVAKLADFGWCAELEANEAPRHTFCGTVDYLSPEAAPPPAWDFKVDIWAAGVLLFEMLTAKPPFVGFNQALTIEAIRSADFEFPEYVSALARDLVSKLLVKERWKRPSLVEVAEHPWMHQHVVLPRLLQEDCLRAWPRGAPASPSTAKACDAQAAEATQLAPAACGGSKLSAPVVASTGARPVEASAPAAPSPLGAPAGAAAAPGATFEALRRRLEARALLANESLRDLEAEGQQLDHQRARLVQAQTQKEQKLQNVQEPPRGRCSSRGSSTLKSTKS